MNIEKINEEKFGNADLEDVIKFAKGKIKLDIEMKEEGYENQVLRCSRNILVRRIYSNFF